MKQPRLGLYLIDIKYIRNLAHIDDHVMSVSPQVRKSARPFVGIVIICDKKQYCIPLSSPKPKHGKMANDIDFMKILDGDRIIGVLNFNNMIPVNEAVISRLDIRIGKNDTPEAVRYKKLMAKQLTFCQKNQDTIVKKANKLYQIIVTGKANHLLQKRCCDFSSLEKALDKFKPLV